MAGAVPAPAPAVRFRRAAAERLAGIALEAPAIERQLRGARLRRRGWAGRRAQVRPPSWRHDVTMEAGIVEELVRLHGYDRVPPMPVRAARRSAPAC